MPSLPAVEFAELSDPGRDPEKQVNEDSSGYRETKFGHLCVVCDGMGGHAGGQEASQTALQTMFDVFEKSEPHADPRVVLKAAVEEANRKVYGLFTGNPGFGRPGSTLVAILLNAHGTEVAHVGDSRVYLVHQSQVFQITKDHSMVQELVDRGLLTPAKAAVHPQANQITRALGMAAEVDVEIKAQSVAHITGDAFILCSDGLSDLVEPADILGIVGSTATAAQAVGQLVDLANARGGHDNITVQILRAREGAAIHATQVAQTVVSSDGTSAALPQRGQHLGAPEPAPSAPSGKTLDEDPSSASPRATVPLAPVANVPPNAVQAARNRAPRPPPRDPEERREDTRVSVSTSLGIILAMVGIAVILAALLVAFGERRGSTQHAKDAGLNLPVASAVSEKTTNILRIGDAGGD